MTSRSARGDTCTMNMVIHYVLSENTGCYIFVLKVQTVQIFIKTTSHTRKLNGICDAEPTSWHTLADGLDFIIQFLPSKNADNRAGFHGFFSLLLLSMTLLMLCHGDATHQLHTYTHCRVAYSVRAICTLCTESAVQCSTNYGPEGKQRGILTTACWNFYIWLAKAAFWRKIFWICKVYVMYLINVIEVVLESQVRCNWLCMGS
jgi:hypothetical protein